MNPKLEHVVNSQTCLNSCRYQSWSLSIFLGLVIGSLSGTVQAQTTSQRDYIVEMYQAYYQRNPSQFEINQWLPWFQRGNTAEEIHASFISSDELFDRMNRNPDRWFSYVFQVVVGRNPNSQEQNYWNNRYLALRQDRRAFGLEFLSNMGNRRPGSATSEPSNAIQSLGNQVYSQSRSLRSSINSEFSSNASVLRLQANSLVSASARIRSATSQGNPDLQQIRQSVYDARSAYLGLQAGMQGQYGGFNSQLFLNQVQGTLQQLAVEVGMDGGNVAGRPPDYYPPGNIPGWPSPDRPGNGWGAAEGLSLNRLSRALSSEVSSLYFLLQTLVRTDYRYQDLVSDMQWYYGRVNEFATAINDNTRRGRLRRMLQELQDKSGEFNRRIAGQQVDVRLRQGLFQVDQHLAQIQAVIGGGDSGSAGIPPSFPAVPDYRQLLIEIDRAIAECDRLIAIYSSYVIFGRPVQVYLADLRTVRQQLQILRAGVLSNDSALVRREINSVVDGISRLQQPWTQMTRSVNTSYAADMNGLNSAASQIRAYAN